MPHLRSEKFLDYCVTPRKSSLTLFHWENKIPVLSKLAAETAFSFLARMLQPRCVCLKLIQQPQRAKGSFPRGSPHKAGGAAVAAFVSGFSQKTKIKYRGSLTAPLKFPGTSALNKFHCADTLFKSYFIYGDFLADFKCLFNFRTGSEMFWIEKLGFVEHMGKCSSDW